MVGIWYIFVSDNRIRCQSHVRYHQALAGTLTQPMANLETLGDDEYFLGKIKCLI